ncbi:MAG: hypothetical protein GX996_02755 [Firmicutes bacterium]|nr:hypothetical protein [Bacillota bacterium]
MNSRQKVLATLQGSVLDPPAKGEIWVFPRVLESQGFPNNYMGLCKFALKIGFDFCFFSCGGPQPLACEKNILENAVKLAKTENLACGAVVDGPWQRKVQKEGLWPSLKEISLDPSTFEKKINAEAIFVEKELSAWIEAGADLILLTDDLAYTKGPYFSPQLFQQVLLPLYKGFLQSSAQGKVPLGFHADGDVSLIMPFLVSSGFKFFSLEPEAIDLLDVWQKYGKKTTIVSGIYAAWLTDSRLVVKEPRRQEKLADHINKGSLILASACGLYEPSSVELLSRLYTLSCNVSS